MDSCQFSFDAECNPSKIGSWTGREYPQMLATRTCSALNSDISVAQQKWIRVFGDGISEAVVYEHPIAESFRGSIIVLSVITRFANRRWWLHTKKFTLNIQYLGACGERERVEYFANRAR